MALRNQSGSAVRRVMRSAVASLVTVALVVTGSVVSQRPRRRRARRTAPCRESCSRTSRVPAGTRRARPPQECRATVPSQVSRSKRSTPRATSSAPRPAPRTAPTHCPSRARSRAILRVEFSSWGDDYEPAFAAQGAPPATTQGDNNTSVQFVTLDAGGAATGVDFGLVIPDQVIQPDAPIATVIQYAGDPTYTGTDSTADRADARRAAVVEGRQRRHARSLRPAHRTRRLRPGRLGVGGLVQPCDERDDPRGIAQAHVGLRRPRARRNLPRARCPAGERQHPRRRRGRELVRRAGTRCQRRRHRRPRTVGARSGFPDRGLGSPQQPSPIGPASRSRHASESGAWRRPSTVRRCSSRTSVTPGLRHRRVRPRRHHPARRGASARRSARTSSCGRSRLAAGRLYMGYVDTGTAARRVGGMPPT